MICSASRSRCVLLTGSTGLVGHVLLAELLGRGGRCVLPVRGDLSDRAADLGRLLGELGVDFHAAVAEGIVELHSIDLRERIDLRPRNPVDLVIHAAASTDFNASTGGEPRRTNVQGTGHLLDWCVMAGVGSFVLVSSAYSCGVTAGPVREGLHDCVDRFHNDYERSKRDGEILCARWARENARTLTIVRPSVVVGDYLTGRCTRFGGVYLSMRATEMLDRILGDAEPDKRRSVDLRLCGRPGDCQNIVPVGYVAAMTAAIALEPRFHGRVYHLTNPNPPTNERIKRALEAHFGLGGGRWVDPDRFDRQSLSEHDRVFADVSRPIEHYFVDTPRFERCATADVERELGITCPSYDEAAIRRLVRYAQRVGWGRRRTIAKEADTACAAYFEGFLPQRLPHSNVARIAALSVRVRFVLEDVPNGQWLCCWKDGRLIGVSRGPGEGLHDFAFITTRQVFWRAVAGELTPQEAFLQGHAEITGDIERGLKMATILDAFTREHPCHRSDLRVEAGVL